jgi:hypothetical protein
MGDTSWIDDSTERMVTFLCNRDKDNVGIEYFGILVEKGIRFLFSFVFQRCIEERRQYDNGSIGRQVSRHPIYLVTQAWNWVSIRLYEQKQTTQTKRFAPHHFNQKSIFESLSSLPGSNLAKSH